MKQARDRDTIAQVVHELFAPGDNIAWQEGWDQSLTPIREKDDWWRTAQVRSRLPLIIGQFSMRGRGPDVTEATGVLLGKAAAVRNFYGNEPLKDAWNAGLDPYKAELHVIIHFPSHPRGDRPGFRRVLRSIDQTELPIEKRHKDVPDNGALLDTCYTVSGFPEQMEFRDAPPERTEALLSRLARSVRAETVRQESFGRPDTQPVQQELASLPQRVTRILLEDCFDLSIWPAPEGLTFEGTPGPILGAMSLLHKSGLIIPGAN